MLTTISQVDVFEKAAALIRNEVTTNRSKVWMKSIVSRGVGKDVEKFVDDLVKHDKTGRKRGTTWGKGKGKGDRERALNTMGYIGSAGLAMPDLDA
jgi:hypothetical protein